ncbi:MAG TPA: trypsin-like peptidase domain-containing protein [Verrucomicrobiae bacterium]
MNVTKQFAPQTVRRSRRRQFLPFGSGCARSGLRVLSLLLACALPGLAVPSSAAEADVRRDAAVIATEKVLPSVVNIATETIIEYHDWYDELLRQFYGARPPLRQQRSLSLGSGVIIDDDGYILTNFHVVRRATRIQVKLWDGREFDADRVVTHTGTDVALLRIRVKPGEKFKAIRFAPDDDLLLGETVLALGNPFGLGGSVTKGILSSKNRRPARGDEPLNVEDWLQTDAAINPGNSGGPLINLRGELIGLNVAVYREERGERGVGVGFSIPVKQIAAALSSSFTPEATASLWFGAQVRAGAGPLAVLSVQAGSPADRAGLKVDDLVLEVNGRKAATLFAFNTWLTDDTEREARLLVTRRNDQRTVNVQLQPFDDVIRQKLGLTLLELTPQTAQRLGLRSGDGLFIEEVEKNSPAERARLEKGYLITAIDGREVPTLRAVMEILPAKKKGESVNLGLIAPRRIGAGFLQFQQGTVDVPLR